MDDMDDDKASGSQSGGVRISGAAKVTVGGSVVGSVGALASPDQRELAFKSELVQLEHFGRQRPPPLGADGG